MKDAWLRWSAVLLIGAGLVVMSACESGDGDDDEDTTTTTTSTTTTTTVPSLTAPTQISPADGSSFSHFPRSVTLVWGSVSGAAKYKVEVQIYSGGVWSSWLTTTVTGTTHTFNFAGAQPGRWRVTAIDAADTEGPASGWFEFEFTI